MNNQSQAEILTTIILIVVMVAVIFLFTIFEGTMLVADVTNSDDSASLTSADHAKRKLFSCYGYPIPYNMSYGDCDIPINLGEGSIKGMTLEQFDFGICTSRKIIDMVPDSYDDSITYLVPVQVNSTNCPGKLKIFV